MTAKIDEELGNFAQNILEVLSKEAKESDEKIDKLWTDSEKKELAELFGGKKKKNVPNSGFKHILNLFEIEKSEQGLLLLCRIVDSILWVFASENDRKKEKAIVKFDAIAVFSRILRRRLILRIEMESNLNTEKEKEKINMNLEIDRILYKLLLNIGLKDARFNLKIRMAGIVQIMCRMFMKFDELLDCFYPLFIRIARSPRSGQMIGRQEGFVKKLTDKIWYLNGLENAENIHLLDKHLQILFFVLKNRRVRVQIIRDSYCRTLLEILEKHLKACSPKPARRLLSSIFGTTDESTNLAISAHIEVIVTNLAILRLLANNKKARDELISLGTLQICAKKLKSMSDEDGKNGTKSKMMDSLCALSLRCMPTIPYPLENVRFPLDFPLPATSISLLTNSSQNNGRTRNSSSINISFDNAKSSDEEDGIDEDDEGIMEENGANFGMEKSDDEDGQGGGGKQISLPLPKSSKLTPVQLKNYQGFFKEFEDGTRENGQYLKDNENWKQFCKMTKMAMPNRQILPIEMFLSPPGSLKSENLCKTTSSMRKMIVEEMDRTSEKYSNIVYDLDAICFDGGHPEADLPENVGKLDGGRDLIFESRFESGNLRRATQVAPTHYELMLAPDMNQLSEHYQWFFFQVSNTRKDIIYTFEIANCLKPTSMYSQGMQPVMFSIIDKNDGWKRCGYNVCYYRNLYACTEITTTPKIAQNEDNGEEKRKKHYYSMRFNIVFPNTADVVYLAYHFPYTYSFLSASIHEFRRLKLSAVYCREDIIGHSIAGNPMRMLTISSTCSPQELAKKDVIVLSGRVHPGESNASWMMHGILEQLLTGSSSEMYRLREKYLFKVIPMLNPDGVINGSHRCSLAGIDLNRVWDRPNDLLHPEVYHTKAIIQFLCENLNKRPLAFVDLHGHSKKWDYFVYGNNPAESWRSEDAPNCSEQQEDEHLALPRALETVTNSKFNASECRFSITRAKEASARVNIWRQFGVTWAYTLESTYCGFHSKGCQINMGDLKDIGRELLFSFLEISNSNKDT